MECTAFEVAGALSKQATEETIAEVAEDVANDDDVPLAIVRPQSQPGVKPTTSERIMSGKDAVLLFCHFEAPTPCAPFKT